MKGRINMNIPRSEYPNPQWKRKNWLCLNGEWEFDFDFSKSAIERKMYEDKKLEKSIIVPFCPESKLSGIGYTDFIPAVMYRKSITLTKAQLNGRVILHIGACDYESTIYVNSKKVMSHKGGYTHFEADITEFVSEGENSIFIYAEDDIRSCAQPGGKQSAKYNSYGCFYTRTTGIWQSVWLEFVPDNYIVSAKFYPCIEDGTLTISGITKKPGNVEITTSYEGEPTGCVTAYSNGCFNTTIKLSKTVLWEIGNGRLYDITLKLADDIVYSYFGMRSTTLSGMKYLLNGKSVFQRLVLDQGFYPDGIYTAPTEEALINDIKISIGLGFDGARLHEKVFEPRFLYHCDRLGYIVWGEYPNWGLDHSLPCALGRYMKEWTEAVNRDFNHPSIIGWCPFNETWDYDENKNTNELLSSIYILTKNLDPTRPCIDTSGNYHVITDIYDVHDYEQNPELFKSYFEKIDEGIINDQTARRERWKGHQKYEGGPVFVSEYGGIRWALNGSGWGYGNAPKTEEEFIERYDKLTLVLLENENIMGMCYTQLYDVEQEQNGLYTYERKAKFDPEIFRKLNQRKAKIEE